MTRTLKGGIAQVLMKHPHRGYKWLDQLTETQNNTKGWILVDEDEAEVWLKAQGGNPTAKPVEVIGQRMSPQEVEIARLKKELAEAKTSKVPSNVTTTAEPLNEETEESPKKTGRPKGTKNKVKA